MNETYEKLAKKLKIGKSTIYQWKKTRPELYEYLIKNLQNTENKENEEILKYFKKLEKNEKEMYIAEIKARVLRKILK